MEEQTRLLADLTASISSMKSKLEDIHPAVLELSIWKPVVERSVDALRAKLSILRSRVINLARPPSISTSPCSELPPRLPHADVLLPTLPKPVAPAATSGGDNHRKIGHGDSSNQRGYRLGDFAIPAGAPANGMHRLPGPGYDPFEFARGWGSHHFPPPPRLDFPLFDGDNPRAWRLKCEAYFQVCSMHPETWVNCDAMYFIDGALSW
jgi:hypothetical protein